MAIADSAAEKGFFLGVNEMGYPAGGGLTRECIWRDGEEVDVFKREVTSCERCYPTIQQAQKRVESLERAYIRSSARRETCMRKINQSHHAGPIRAILLTLFIFFPSFHLFHFLHIPFRLFVCLLCSPILPTHTFRLLSEPSHPRLSTVPIPFINDQEATPNQAQLDQTQ